MLQVHEVFTPMGYAPHAYVERPVARALREAILAGADLVGLAGPSNSGKTTTAVRTLEALGLEYELVLCRTGDSVVDLLGIPGPAARLLEDVHKVGDGTRDAVLAASRDRRQRREGPLIALGTRPWPPEDGSRARRIDVSRMTRQEVGEALARGAAVMGMVLPPAMVAAIVEHAGGDPSLCHLFAQHLCLEAGVYVQAPAPVTVTPEAFVRARGRTPSAVP